MQNRITVILHSKSRILVTRLCVPGVGALCDTDLLGCFNWVHHSPLQDVDGGHPASTACVVSNQVVRNSSLSLVCRHTYGNSRYLLGRNRVRGLGKASFLSILTLKCLFFGVFHINQQTLDLQKDYCKTASYQLNARCPSLWPELKMFESHDFHPTLFLSIVKTHTFN